MLGKNLQEIKLIDELEISGKVVFIRADFNVPVVDGKITDDYRIRAAIPTIKYAMDQGAKVVLGTHFGRPKGKPEDWKKYSLEIVANRLAELTNYDVLLVEVPTSDAPKALLQTLRPNQLVMLENLRFEPGEEANTEFLVERISKYAEVYINDAFGASHRAHASIVGLPVVFQQKGIGFLMKKEVEMLDLVLSTNESPYVAILGGSKVSDKIEIIDHLADKVDTFVIGGAMAYTFLKAAGYAVGSSLVEKDKLTFAKNFLERMATRGKSVLLPLDHVVARKFGDPKELSRITDNSSIDEGWMGLDIGPKTQSAFKEAILAAKVVFWNGPMGVFENPDYAAGSMTIAKAMAESDAMTIVGGGDSASAAQMAGVTDSLSHVSTGGGASLEYLQGVPLPGLLALRGKKIH